MDELNADGFLNHAESNVEVLWSGNLQLVFIRTWRKGGRCHKVDFNVEGEFLSFAGCLLYLLDNRSFTKQEIAIRGRDFHIRFVDPNKKNRLLQEKNITPRTLLWIKNVKDFQ
ncbi:hypothetical protein E2320_011012, partial [Naja naja]